MRLNFVLPLPRFVLHPLTAWTIAAVHLYLAYGHLTKLFGGDAEWVHVWKGFGALFGAYIFTALASRRPAKSTEGLSRKRLALKTLTDCQSPSVVCSKQT